MKKKVGVVCSVGAVITMLLQSGEAPINRAGLELIGHAESCRYEPYLCPAGTWTDGIGNTTGVSPGNRKTLQQITKDWAQNIRVAKTCVLQHFNGKRMNENQLASFTSLVFRIGCYGVRTYYDRSRQDRIETTIHKLAVAGEFVAACYRITDFVNANGQPMRGLILRAEREKALCLTPV